MKPTDKAARVRRVYADLNRKFEEQDTQRRARKQQLPYFDLFGFPIEESVLGIVPQETAQATGAIPFFKESSLLRLGITRPDDPQLSKLLTQLRKQRFEVELYLVSENGLAEALKQYKKVIQISPTGKEEIVVKTGSRVVQELNNIQELGQRLRSVAVSELLDLILGAAVTMQASDIHLEPQSKLVQVRFRIDGVLQEVAPLSVVVLGKLLSRIKLLAGLKLNVTTAPQDGRFSVTADQKKIELRVSVLPTARGESVVIRILGAQGVILDTEKLGLRERDLKLIREELKKPNGMLLTTGPTGSGKTTTLYTFLNLLNQPGLKIITIEDPVEYQLPGITQTPIDRKAGMDFVKVLRSILRQDPDVVMVGEIRDFETAETASQAALTGHVVLSTMHTNDAAGAIPRLLDLGVKPVILAPALNALMAQRLLRRLCQNCKEIKSPERKELERVGLVLQQLPERAKRDVPEHLSFYHSRGCQECHNLGYRGRIGVFEVFAIDEPIEQLIFEQASTADIKKAAQAQGMTTMQQGGILKALQGLTDLAEVWRVTEE